jgi:nicotinamide/nicotinate riboside kinase
MIDPDDAAAGGVWVDPPNYFEQIVYPAYVKAHEMIFEDGDVESGRVREEWKDLKISAPREGVKEMTMAFDQGCSAMEQHCKNGIPRYINIE